MKYRYEKNDINIMTGKFIRNLYDGTASGNDMETVTFRTDGLPNGPYLIKLTACGKMKSIIVNVVK